jgi:hypothetical protein
MPASMKAALTGFIGSNRDTLQFFAKGAKSEQSRYPVDFNLGAEALFPHLTRMKQATQMLQLAAALHAEAKDTKSSAGDLYSALALANSLRAEPNLFSQFVRGRLAAIAVAGLEQSINRYQWASEDLSQIANLLHKMEDSDANGEGFSRGVVGERLTSMALLEKPGKFLELLPGLSVDIPPERRARMSERLQSGKLQTEEYFYEQALTKSVELRKQPFPGRLSADDLVRQQIADAENKQLVLANFLLSGLRTEATKEAECLAWLRLGLTAIALEQFRAGHDNRYPASLSELTADTLPAPPLDPYDGQPLRYKTKNDGYLLYSIGPDLRDNSGQRMNGGQGDLVFTVVTPPKNSQ